MARRQWIVEVAGMDRIDTPFQATHGKIPMTSRVRKAAVFLAGLILCGQAHAERLVLAKLLAEPAGEQYGAKRINFDVGKHKAFILQPAKPATEGASPWVW